MRTVLVGNGASALGKGLGRRIDARDRVVRFNHFVLEGFERDLGRRTTDHVHHVGVRERRAGVERSWWMCAPKDYYKLYGDADVPAADVIPVECAVEAGHAAGLAPNCHASSGLVGLWWAMAWDPEEPVVMVNFDHGKTGHYWQAGHEHSTNHEWDKERSLVRRLVREGKVVRW